MHELLKRGIIVVVHYGIAIKNKINGDESFEISCPAIKTSADMSKLNVSIEQKIYNLYSGGAQTTDIPDKVFFEKEFIKEGKIKINVKNMTSEMKYYNLTINVFSARMFVITVTYPKYNGGNWQDSASLYAKYI